LLTLKKKLKVSLLKGTPPRVTQGFPDSVVPPSFIT